MRPIILAFLVLLLGPLPAEAAVLPPGQALTQEIVAGLIEEALRESGGERHEVTIEAPALPMANPARRPAELVLQTFSAEPRGRFRGSLHVRLDTGEESTIALVGRARTLVSIAVPARRVERGQQITPEALAVRWVPDGPAAAEAVRDLQEVVGREARRTLVAGRAIRDSDLTTPRLVQRGEAVTIFYESVGLQVRTVGEALDGGSEGDAVRVVNPDTRLVRRGVVAGRKLVRVQSAGGAAG
jgi:flagella basal body P-ring formation protein FlgA